MLKPPFKKETLVEVGDYFKDQDVNFFKLILDLRKRSLPDEKGPIFKLQIKLLKGKVRFLYYREGDEFSSIEDIPKDIHGGIPSFVYRKMFSKDLILATENYRMTIDQSEFVQALIRADKPVPEKHKLFYSLSDLIGDVNNGGFNQYFERTKTWDSVQLPRKDLYADVDAALAVMDFSPARDIFREALAIYAHLYPRVETARKALGIPAIEKQETTDLDSRYYDILSDLEKNFAAYIKTNLDDFIHDKIS